MIGYVHIYLHTRSLTHTKIQNQLTGLKRYNYIYVSNMANTFPVHIFPIEENGIFTIVDVNGRKLLKGPYEDQDLIAWIPLVHDIMIDVFHDEHTLPVTRVLSHLEFELFAGAKPTFKHYIINQRTFGLSVYMPRFSLNIKTLVCCDKLPELPLTVWLHYCYRFILGIDNADLSHCLVDMSKTKYACIDMKPTNTTKSRQPTICTTANDGAAACFIKMIFVPTPKKEHVGQLKSYYTRHQTELKEHLYYTGSVLDTIGADTFAKINVDEAQVKFRYDKLLSAVRRPT